MDSKEGGTNKTKIILICIAIFVIISAYIFLLTNIIETYSNFDIDYDDLLFEELTFDKFEKTKRGKSGYIYNVYFKEYDEPFLINPNTNRAVNVEVLESLKENKRVTVYYDETSHRGYEYVVCEMNYDTNSVLKLSDYVKLNQDNQVTGMIVSTAMAIGCLMLVWGFHWKSKIDYSGEDIGKVRVEYILDGNVIRVYNAPVVCSLVINDKIVDQEYGLQSYKFSLKGNLKNGTEIIPVEAKVRYIFIQLYVKGKRVKSGFVGFT